MPSTAPTDAAAEDGPVTGRDCGECTACCTALKIDEPGFKKLAGVTCAHCVSGGGCSIYDSRPSICQAWFCGWRLYPWLSPDMWPHKSGIVVRVRKVPGALTEEAAVGLTFHVLTSLLALYDKAVWKALGTSILNDIPTYLGVSAPVGYEGSLIHLNESLTEPLRNRDADGIKRALRRAYFTGRTAVKAKSEFSSLV